MLVVKFHGLSAELHEHDLLQLLRRVQLLLLGLELLGPDVQHLRMSQLLEELEFLVTTRSQGVGATCCLKQ